MWKLALLLVVSSMAVDASAIKKNTKPCPDDCVNKPLDLSFIVDASASIGKSNFTVGLWFIQNFVDGFEIGPGKTRVSMVTFGDRVYGEDAIGFDDHADKASLDTALDEIPYPSGRATETGMGIKWFMENQYPHAREGVRQVVIVLTDGNSQSRSKTKKEAAKALEAGLEVFAIGVGQGIGQEELHNIASDSKHVFVVSDYNALEDIRQRLVFAACGVKPNPVCGFSPVDVGFVIDSSRSIGQDNFTLELDFIKQFLSVFEINPSSTRVAAVMFGDRVYAEHAFNFDTYSTKKETLDAVQGLTYMFGSSTQTGAGIEYMIKNFAPQFRPHIPHVGIIITDGRSQKWMYTRRAAQEARDAGITTVAVGVGKVGDVLDQEELDHIAGDPSRVITADDFNQLNTIRETLIDITCAGIAQGIKDNAKAVASASEGDNEK